MSIISLIIILVVIGIVLWLVNTQLGAIIDGKILKIINVVVVVLVVLWLLSIFFDLGSIGSVPVHRIGR